MKNLLKIFGVIALLAVIGFSTVSCDDKIETGTEIVVTYNNNSTQTVTVTMDSSQGWKPGSFSIAPGGTQQVKTTKDVSTVSAQYVPANLVTYTWNGSTNTYTFTNK
ncbi:MAG: hypothetical protein LBU85_11780 [Treponema sp.]|jgi:hypothetical protein|nr:hypothetical protein [Treponema sp.]